jgi:hypothetical protein
VGSVLLVKGHDEANVSERFAGRATCSTSGASHRLRFDGRDLGILSVLLRIP